MRGVVLGCLVAAALAGCESSNEEDLQRAQLCRQTLQGLDEAAREQSSLPQEEFRRMIRESCENGTFGQTVPAGEPTPTPASRGCAGSRGPGKSHRPRTARPPARDVPYFARRTGRLPDDGSPVVAGVTLPPGSRCARAWVSDEPVHDPIMLASRLAAAFERTGLWPVLWYWEDHPDAYLGEPYHEPGDGAGAAEILRKLWETSARYPSLRAATAPFGRRFPGLATGSRGPRVGDIAREPFRTLARHPPDGGQPRPWLLLVPVNRPADVPATLAIGLPEDIASDSKLSTVLRSWEERFGAVLVAVGAGSIALVVDRPPTTEKQALRLSAEQWAIGPVEDGGRAGTVRDVAGLLIRGRPVTPDWGPGLRLTREVWEFGWS